MKFAAACFLFAACIGFCMLVLIADSIVAKLSKRRERKAMRVRDADLRRYGMAAFKGTKSSDWWQL